MLKKFKLIPLLLAALFVKGCSEPAFIAMPEELKDDIHSSEAFYEKVQGEVYANIESTNISALNSGLLFSLIEAVADGVKKSNIEKSLEPVQAHYSAARLETKLRTALHKALKNTKWLHLSELKAAGSIEPDAFKALLNKSTKDVVVVTEFDLRLNPRLDVLTGTLFVGIYPAKAKMKEKLGVKDVKEKAIYKTKLMATSSLEHFTEDADQNASKWAANQGAALWKGIDKVVTGIGSQLEEALKNPCTVIGQ